jgi:hypothetical protein
MGFRAPLTKAQLREIGLRRDPGDIAALLWEIKRLRATVLRADQLQRVLGTGSGGAVGIVLEGLRQDLKDEPCITESPRLDNVPR